MPAMSPYPHNILERRQSTHSTDSQPVYGIQLNPFIGLCRNAMGIPVMLLQAGHNINKTQTRSTVTVFTRMCNPTDIYQTKIRPCPPVWTRHFCVPLCKCLQCMTSPHYIMYLREGCKNKRRGRFSKVTRLK